MGNNATTDTKIHTGISINAICVETGRLFPPSNVHTGRINAESIMFAPTIFPTDKEDSFLMIAVTVVTNYGREVPIATIVTDMISSLICNFSTISHADFTRISEPTTIATAPIKNQTNIFQHSFFCVLLSFF